MSALPNYDASKLAAPGERGETPRDVEEYLEDAEESIRQYRRVDAEREEERHLEMAVESAQGALDRFRALATERHARRLRSWK